MRVFVNPELIVIINITVNRKNSESIGIVSRIMRRALTPTCAASLLGKPANNIRLSSKSQLNMCPLGGRRAGDSGQRCRERSSGRVGLKCCHPLEKVVREQLHRDEHDEDLLCGKV